MGALSVPHQATQDPHHPQCYPLQSPPPQEPPTPTPVPLCPSPGPLQVPPLTMSAPHQPPPAVLQTVMAILSHLSSLDHLHHQLLTQ